MTLARIALRNLLKHRRRTLVLGGAIAFVMVLLVFMVGISRGMQATMLRSATTLMTGHVNVAGFYKLSPTDAAPLVTDYKKVRALVLENVPELDYAIDRARGWGKIISDTSSQYAALAGVHIDEEKGFAQVLKLLDGDVASLRQPGTALIFKTHADRLGVGVGDTLTISAPTFRGVNNTVTVRVGAVAADIGFMSSFIIYVPADTVRSLYQLSDQTTGAIMLYLRDRTQSDAVAQRLRGVLERAGYTLMPPSDKQFWHKFDTVRREDWTGQRLDVTTWEDEISFLSVTVKFFDLVSYVVVAVMLLIIIVGVMNALWMAIRERTGEIGTLRAIGMQRPTVLWMFLLEALILSGGATVFGALAGWGLAAGLNAAHVPISSQAIEAFLMNDTLILDVSFTSIVTSVLTITVVTTLGALYPAYRAARMSPVTAIQRAS